MVALVAALALVLAAPPVNFIDPTGDSGTAPDITKISVGETDAGLYEFKVYFATPYGANSNLLVYLDTDKNQQTGDSNGSDYLIASQGLSTWNATTAAWQSAGAPDTFTVAPDGSTVTVDVPPSALGNTLAFDFIVQSVDGAGGAGHTDTAVGQWSTTASVAKLTISSSHATAAKAGGTWTIEASGVPTGTSSAGQKGTVACTATAGGKKLAVTHSVAVPTPGGVSGLCIFTVPKSAKHKKLAAAMALSIAGESATQKFTATAK